MRRQKEERNIVGAITQDDRVENKRRLQLLERVERERLTQQALIEVC